MRVFSVAAIAAGTGTAAARSYTDCNRDSCVQVHCEWDGDNCWRENVYYTPGYGLYYRDYDRGYYGGYDSDRVCDSSGDNCHLVPD